MGAAARDCSKFEKRKKGSLGKRHKRTFTVHVTTYEKCISLATSLSV